MILSSLLGPLILLSDALGAAPRQREVESAGVLTLEAAIHRALERSLELRRLAGDYERALTELRAVDAETAWRWQPASALERSDGGETRRGGLTAARELPWGAEIRLGADTARTEGLASDRQQTLRASIFQPLLNLGGARRHRLARLEAEARIRKVLRTLEQTRADLALQVTRLFYEWHLARDQVRLEQESRRRLELYRRIQEIRLGTPNDVEVVPARLLVTALPPQGEGLEAAKTRLGEIVEELSDLMGCTPEDLPPLAPAPWPEPPAPDLDSAIEVALAHRLDWAQALDDWRAAGSMHYIVGGYPWPDLGFAIHVERQFSERWEDTMWWGVGLRVAEWNPASERLRRELADLDYRRSGDEAERVRLRVEREVRRAFHEWRRAGSALEEASRAADRSRERLRALRRLLEVGHAEIYEVLAAEEDLRRQTLAHMERRTAAALAAHRLRHAMGTLLDPPPDLRPGAIGALGGPGP